MSNSYSNRRNRIPRPQVCQPSPPPFPETNTGCTLNHESDTIENGMTVENEFTYDFPTTVEGETYSLFISGDDGQVSFPTPTEVGTPVQLTFENTEGTGSWSMVITGVQDDGTACSKQWDVTSVDPSEEEEEPEEGGEDEEEPV